MPSPSNAECHSSYIDSDDDFVVDEDSSLSTHSPDDSPETIAYDYARSTPLSCMTSVDEDDSSTDESGSVADSNEESFSTQLSPGHDYTLHPDGSPMAASRSQRSDGVACSPSRHIADARHIGKGAYTVYF